MAVSKAELARIVQANEDRLMRDPFFLARCIEKVNLSGRVTITIVNEAGTEHPAEVLTVTYHAGGDGEVSIAVGTREGMTNRAKANNNAVLYRDFVSLAVPK